MIDKIKNIQAVLSDKLMSATKEDFARMLDEELRSGKRATDFIGMIVGAGFTSFGIAFFVELGRESESIILKIASGATLVLCLGLSVFLYAKILGVLLAYLCNGVAVLKSKWARILSVIVGVLEALAVYISIAALVSALAKKAGMGM